MVALFVDNSGSIRLEEDDELLDCLIVVCRFAAAVHELFEYEVQANCGELERRYLRHYLRQSQPVRQTSEHRRDKFAGLQAEPQQKHWQIVHHGHRLLLLDLEPLDVHGSAFQSTSIGRTFSSISIELIMDKPIDLRTHRTCRICRNGNASAFTLG